MFKPKVVRGITYEKAHCLMIDAEGAGWMENPGVRRWIESDQVAHWPLAAGGDVFTVYDHGDGPDCPEVMAAGPGVMPQWLWERIVDCVQDAGLVDEYVIIRLMGT